MDTLEQTYCVSVESCHKPAGSPLSSSVCLSSVMNASLAHRREYEADLHDIEGIVIQIELGICDWQHAIPYCAPIEGHICTCNLALQGLSIKLNVRSNH